MMKNIKRIINIVALLLLFVIIDYSQNQKKDNSVSNVEKFSEKSETLVSKKYFFVGSSGLIQVYIVEVTNLISNIKMSGIQVFIVENSLDREQIEFNAAERELKRITEFLETGQISRSEYDRAKDRFMIAQANLRNAKGNIGKADNKTAFVDPVEVDGLINSITILKNKVLNTKPESYTEVSYVTKSGFGLGSFFNDGRWTSYVKTSKTSPNFSTELDSLQNLLQESKKKLQLTK